jgi:DNA topoisomerase-2
MKLVLNLAPTIPAKAPALNLAPPVAINTQTLNLAGTVATKAPALNLAPPVATNTQTLNLAPHTVPDENRYNNFANTQTNGPLANEYKNYEHLRDHIYDRPSTYIGTDTMSKNFKFLLNPQTLKLEEREIEYCEGVERLFLEGISNMGDNAEKSRRYRCNPGKAIITMDSKVIRMKNGGVVIPVEQNSEGVWIPFVIFGKLLSSSNYDKTIARMGCGTNGLGSKLINIFSVFFKIIICDSIRKLKYTQIWRNGMRTIEEAIIEPYTGSENSVELEYEMDFARFGMTEYTPEYFQLYAAYVADFSWTCKLPISFNGVNLNYQNLKDYAKLYYPDDTKMIFHYEWPEQVPIMDKNNKMIWTIVEFEEKAGKRVPKDKSIVPIAELCIIDTPDAGSQISFANGMRTPMGGVHVEGAIKAVSDIVLGYFNEPGKKTGEKKIKLTPSDIKAHMSILLSVRVPDPQYKGQAKEYLVSPKTKFNIPEKIIKPMESWDLFHRLYFALEAKQFKEIKKSDGKKSKNVNSVKLQDANFAGTKRSEEAVLFLCEGDSSVQYVMKLIALLPGGRDKYGVFPLKGKGLNVMNANAKQIAENTEIIEIKKIVGLREGIDYNDPINLKTLRYRWIIVLSDSDKDGTHIIGLCLCLFYCRFPTLIQCGAISYMRTPIVRVTKGKQVIKFYTETAFNKWLRETPNAHTWKTKYFKGLGTSTKEQIQDDSKTPKVVQCLPDEKTSDTMRLAFDKKLADRRKVWMQNYIPGLELEDITIQHISDFINYQFIQFSLVDLHRSLPKLMDGLKNSLRKIVWTIWKEWKFKHTGEEMKVCDLASVVSKDTKYHYGSNSLSGAIIGMAQNIVGLNNLPFFKDEGGFGSRDKNGKDAAADRYISVKPNWWLEHVFKIDDIPLLTSALEEGKPCEPEFFLPIIPIAFLNGIIGIGTGSSTTILPYHALDLSNWIRDEINGIQHKNIIPWYNKFTGTIEVKNNGKVGVHLNIVNENNAEEQIEVKENAEDLEDIRNQLAQEEIEEKKAQGLRNTMTSYGKLEVVNGVATITELPIGKYPNGYRNYLKLLIEDGQITHFDDHCDEFKETVLFKVYGFKNPTIEHLKLYKSIGMSNMVFLDNNDKPHKYENVQVALKEWYNLRLPFYDKRRLHKLKDLQEKLTEYGYKIRFYQAVISGQIDIRSKKSEILAIVTAMGIPAKIYLDCKLSNISKEEVEEFQNEVEQCKKEVQYYTNVLPTRLWLDDLDNFETQFKKNMK